MEQGMYRYHFWRREELQAKKSRFGPFYNNIYNVARILGVVD